MVGGPRRRLPRRRQPAAPDPTPSPPPRRPPLQTQGARGAAGVRRVRAAQLAAERLRHGLYVPRAQVPQVPAAHTGPVRLVVKVALQGMRLDPRVQAQGLRSSTFVPVQLCLWKNPARTRASGSAPQASTSAILWHAGHAQRLQRPPPRPHSESRPRRGGCASA